MKIKFENATINNKKIDDIAYIKSIIWTKVIGN